jgi:hypothetical protein
VLHKINQSQRISGRNYYLFEQRTVILLVEAEKSLHVVRESHRVVVQQRLALEDVDDSFLIAHVDLSKKGSSEAPLGTPRSLSIWVKLPA